MRKTLLGAALAAGLLAVGAAPATAAPPEREIITLQCDNEETYDIVVNGNGSFTPGRIVNSTGVLVPIAFGDFTFSAVTPDNEVVVGSLDEGESKGGGNVAIHNPRPTVNCTFEQTFTLVEDDEEFGLPAGTVVTFGGSVTGYLTGR